jgi:hypothetical protein
MPQPNKKAASTNVPEFGEWRPIDSAPRDGTQFLAVFGDNSVSVVRWDRAWSDTTLRISPPSLWMPMPKAPAANGG